MPRFYSLVPNYHCVARFAGHVTCIAGFCLLLLWLSATASAQECQVPQPPSLTATATSLSKISITWNVVATNNPNYQVFMSSTGVNGSFVHMGSRYAYSWVNSLTTEFGGFNANETVYFYVTAYGCDTSVPSNIASATTPDFGYPTLAATATTADFGHITLSWSVVDGASPTYQVYMSDTGASGSFTHMGNVYHGNPDISTLTGRYGNFGPNQTRYFYILANNGNTSHQSNIVSATTADIGYPTLKAQAANKTQITLTWNVVANAYPTYPVFLVDTTANNSETFMGNRYANPGVTSLTAQIPLTSLDPSHNYYLYVRANSDNNTSHPSNFVGVALDDNENAGTTSCNARVGGPINVTNGNMYLQQTDYRLSGIGEALQIIRTYNSVSQRAGLFGHGWTSAYDEAIQVYADTGLVRLYLPDGRAVGFSRAGTLFAPMQPDFHDHLGQNADGSFTLTLKDGGIHRFNSAGKLLSLADRNNNQTTLTYDATGKPTTITDSFGRTLNLTIHPTNGRVASISDATGAIATYTYGSSSELQSVTYADGSQYWFAYIYSPNMVLSSVTDALGNVIEAHAYDSQGRATTSEKQGGVERFTLNYVGSTETHVTDALGHITKYFFDTSKGRNVVTRVEGACSCGGSQTKTWTYDNGLNVTGKTDALGHTETFTYDANGNRLTETDVLGTSTYTYNSFGQVLTAIDRMGGVTINTYDAQGRLLTTKDALNNTTTFTYGAGGLLRTATDARAKVTTFDYDTSGNLTRKTDAAGGTTDSAYDARGRLVSMTDALGKTTTYAYDAAGRVTKVTRPDATFVTIAYDLAGRRTRITDARGNSTEYTYDGAYRLTGEKNADNRTTTYGYDSMSNRTSMTDAMGRTTNYEYDDFDRLVKTIYPAAVSGATRLEERIEYDLGGNVKKRFDQAGRATSYEYDAADRLTKTIDAALKETQYEYNARSNMTAMVDGINQRYTFAHDALGRVTETTRGGATMTFAYDATGNRTSRTDYNGVTTAYDYDALNRLVTTTYPDAGVATYAYDKLSRLRTATNANGAVVMSYDDMGRVSSTTDVWGQTIGYGYDANGNRSSLTLGGATLATYQHDALNRVSSITDAAGAAVTYAYDATNKLTTRALPNGVTATYQYDDLNRLTRLTDAKATTTIADAQYGYNSVSNITQKVDGNGSQAYDYDALDRLTSATRPNTPTETYAYDAVGNRTSSHRAASYTYESPNRLVSSQQATYATTFAYNANGNLTGQSGSSGVWDYENRLLRVSVPGYADVAYKYDALGRRVEREQGGAAKRFVYDGQDVVRDLNPDGSVTEYLNGLGVDEKLRQSSPAGVFYFTTDHLGSTMALTDTAGNVVERMSYDAFGDTPASPRTRYTYTGRERDEFTGLYYYRARWYDAVVGRFISEDPIGFAGGDVNLYGYVKNNPMNFTDPSGLKVYRCYRPTRFNFFGHEVSIGYHHWIKTDTREAGLGACGSGVPGQGNPDIPYVTQTCINDHTGQSAEPNSECYEVPFVDESLVDRYLNIGEPRGRWTPWNQCITFAGAAINAGSSPTPEVPISAIYF